MVFDGGVVVVGGAFGVGGWWCAQTVKVRLLRCGGKVAGPGAGTGFKDV